MDIKCLLYLKKNGIWMSIKDFSQRQINSITLWSLPELSKYSKRCKILQYEGIYSFGGISDTPSDSDSQLCTNNDMRFMRVGQGYKEWIILEIAGTPPEPRFFHSMDYFESNTMIVIFGGRIELKIRSINFSLNDVWLMDLKSLEWINLICRGNISILN